jgi:LAS superfamily LD-carboxypeptidase LdcB
MLNALELTGRTTTHLQVVPELSARVHRALVQPLLAMREVAAQHGIDLAVASSFRDFARQEGIWNAKFAGQRPLLDRRERLLDIETLNERQRIDAILSWSALPGASRHHWGTDIDVFDRAMLPQGVQPQLTVSEFDAHGPFQRLAAWLEMNMQDFGFFRPYCVDQGGVMPEPWHLSYAPVATNALQEFTIEVLFEAVAVSKMYGREQVLARLPELYQRYVRGVSSPPTRLS